MTKITCSADQLLNPRGEEDHAHLLVEKERDIASNLMGLTFLKLKITGGPRSLFNRAKVSPPVFLDIEDAMRLRNELDAFIEAHSDEWDVNGPYAQAPTEPIPQMKIIKDRKHD